MSITFEELPVVDIPERARVHGPSSADRRARLQLVPSSQGGSSSAVLRPRVRLTRRGRIVVTLMALAIVTVLMIAFGSGSAATDSSASVSSTETITVQPGETLWSIAGEVTPAGADIRDTVNDITKLNALVAGDPLQMGAQLAIPVYSD